MFAIDLFRSIGRIGGLYVYIAFHTFSVPENSRCPFIHPFQMPLIRMLSRDRQFHLSVKCQFLRDNLIILFADLALEDLINDFITHISYIIWNDICLAYIFFFFFISPSETSCKRKLFGQWEIFVSHGFIVSIRRIFLIKKFSPFSINTHFFNDLWKKLFIFRFGVLLVEDTVLFFSEADTAEAIITIKT